MFCSTVQIWFIERLFYLKRMTNIYLLDIVFIYWGVTKTNTTSWKCSKPYSWFIHKPSSKFYLVDIFKTPTKSSKIPNFHIPNPLSYPISSKPTKIKHFSHFTSQKSNFYLAKNLPLISKSSLYISNFTDNQFSQKYHTKLFITPNLIMVGVHKNHTINSIISHYYQ